MRIWKLLGLVVVPLVLMSGCEVEEEPEVVEEPTVIGTPPAVPPAGPPATGTTAGAATINMQPLNNSGVTGEATVTPMDGQTQVTVMLSGSPQAGTHQGHIHQGTCESLGSVVTPLQPIETPAGGTGTMITMVDLAPATVMNGQHIIAYHEAGGDPGQAVVCGSIPAQTM